MTVMNTLSDGRILRSFSRGVVPCPQPGATLFGCGEGPVRLLVVGRYTSQRNPGIVRRREVRVLGDESGQLAVIEGIRAF